MAYLAKDKDGTEWLFTSKPLRYEEEGEWVMDLDVISKCLPLEKGSIEMLIKGGMNWEDEPVEI